MFIIRRWNNWRRVCRAVEKLKRKKKGVSTNGAVKHKRTIDVILSHRELRLRQKTKPKKQQKKGHLKNDVRKAFQGSWSELLHQVFHLRIQHHILGKSPAIIRCYFRPLMHWHDKVSLHQPWFAFVSIEAFSFFFFVTAFNSRHGWFHPCNRLPAPVHLFPAVTYRHAFVFVSGRSLLTVESLVYIELSEGHFTVSVTDVSVQLLPEWSSSSTTILSSQVYL